MALACEPDILIADEPTTALDVTIQAQILELMKDLQKKMGMAIIIVTHDLGVIAQMADEIIVMYGGRVCERGTAEDIFYRPAHEYTKGLLRSIPSVDKIGQRLVPISGTPINLLNLPKGCAFCPRCDAAMKICLEQVPPETRTVDGHLASCWMAVKKEAEAGMINFTGDSGRSLKADDRLTAYRSISDRARHSGWSESPAVARRRSDARSCAFTTRQAEKFILTGRRSTRNRLVD